MKKIIYTVLGFLFTCLFANAATVNVFDESYTLQEVQKNGSNYINYYAKSTETPENWTSRTTVISLPKEDSEFDYINDYINRLSGNRQFKLIGFYPELNMFSYGIIYNKSGNGYIEYNVVKCQSTKQKGIRVIHFSKKYEYKGQDEFATAADICFNNNLKFIENISKTKIPEIKKRK